METVAKKVGWSESFPSVVEGRQDIVAAVRLLVALEIQSQPPLQRPLRPHTVNRLLHLPVTPVAPLDRVRGRWQQLGIQEGQRLRQVGRMQLDRKSTRLNSSHVR